MKKPVFKKIAQAAGIALALAFTFSCSDDDSSGSDPNPDSKIIAWKQDGVDYKLALTDLSASGTSGTYTYILSVGTQGYSTGTSELDGNAYSLTPRDGGSFTIEVSDSKQVTTSNAQSIILTSSTGGVDYFTIPTTDAQGTVTDNTGGKGENPFTGTWSGQAGTVICKNNLTWTYSGQGNMSGSYAFLDNTAIIYTSSGDFFGYATISGSTMTADTDDGRFTFSK